MVTVPSWGHRGGNVGSGRHEDGGDQPADLGPPERVERLVQLADLGEQQVHGEQPEHEP
jgi:hypothetical protein